MEVGYYLGEQSAEEGVKRARGYYSAVSRGKRKRYDVIPLNFLVGGVIGERFAGQRR